MQKQKQREMGQQGQVQRKRDGRYDREQGRASQDDEKTDKKGGSKRSGLVHRPHQSRRNRYLQRW
jgi:hypothetical protein